MDNALLVGRLQRLGDLLRDRQRLVDGNGSPHDAIGQGWPLDQLHDEGGRAGTLLQPVDDGNVWMIQRGEHFRFPLEAGQSLGILGDGFWQHLDGHLPLQVRVCGAIDLAHAARADLRGDVIRTESGAWCKCHAVEA